MCRRAVRLIGRNEKEAALRDAVLLTADGRRFCTARKVFLAYKRLSAKLWTPREGMPAMAVAFRMWSGHPAASR